MINKNNVLKYFEEYENNSQKNLKQVGNNNFQFFKNIFKKDIKKYFFESYKLSGEAKIKGICDFLKEIFELQQKSIIFAFHLEILNQIEFFFNTNQMQYVRIDGNLKDYQKQDSIYIFQNRPLCQFALLSIKACSSGFTLTQAQNVIFAEMDWTPAIMQQAEDRAHRIGQKQCIECYYLIGENTLDQYIYDRLNRKSNIVQQIIDGQTSNNFSLQSTEIKGVKENKNINIIKTAEKTNSGQKKLIDQYFSIENTKQKIKKQQQQKHPDDHLIQTAEKQRENRTKSDEEDDEYMKKIIKNQQNNIKVIYQEKTTVKEQNQLQNANNMNDLFQFMEQQENYSEANTKQGNIVQKKEEIPKRKLKMLHNVYENYFIENVFENKTIQLTHQEKENIQELLNKKIVFDFQQNNNLDFFF